MSPSARARRRWFLTTSAALLLAGALAGCAGPRLAPTPNLYADSDVDPFAEVVPAYQSTEVEVLYATDRMPDNEEGEPLSYGYGRSKSLAVGVCTVAMGIDADWDALVAASRTSRRSASVPLLLTDITEIVRFPESNSGMVKVGDELVADPEIAGARREASETVARLIDERLAMTPRKEIFLFIHGYNNVFRDAAFRMAQLWHFMGREGVPVMYTWPAGHGGMLRGYTYDRESGEFTVFHLKETLRGLAASTDVERIHLIAHSRGTDVLITALRELHLEIRGAGKDTREELKMGHLVLAAPDMDWEVSSQRMGSEHLVFIPETFTVYLSEEDRAIGLAEWLFASATRIGRLRETDLTDAQRDMLEVLTDLEMIDVQASTGFLGHGYFISNPAVLSDLILLLRDGCDPGAEHGRPLIERERGFWQLKDGYPNREE